MSRNHGLREFQTATIPILPVFGISHKYFNLNEHETLTGECQIIAIFFLPAFCISHKYFSLNVHVNTDDKNVKYM